MKVNSDPYFTKKFEEQQKINKKKLKIIRKWAQISFEKVGTLMQNWDTWYEMKKPD